MASVHDEKKNMKCDFCDYTCFQLGNLKRHVASIHDGNKEFHCDFGAFYKYFGDFGFYGLFPMKKAIANLANSATIIRIGFRLSD